jgi:hypothetical protein
MSVTRAAKSTTVEALYSQYQLPHLGFQPHIRLELSKRAFDLSLRSRPPQLSPHVQRSGAWGSDRAHPKRVKHATRRRVFHTLIFAAAKLHAHSVRV